ncbi:MAG: hypothetical protein ACI88A_000447 [Paraglaciecola sp.]|jgi:hypothetical protein
MDFRVKFSVFSLGINDYQRVLLILGTEIEPGTFLASEIEVELMHPAQFLAGIMNLCCVFCAHLQVFTIPRMQGFQLH